MKAFYAVTLAVALGTAACNSITGNNDEDNFVFDSIVINYDSAMVDNAEAFGFIRNLQVDGLWLLPHRCHDIRGDYQRQGGLIVLTVLATPNGVSCPAAIAPLQYRLSTFGMDPGAYRVRVYHQFSGQTRTLIVEDDLVIG
jgi:hypothetical protein